MIKLTKLPKPQVLEANADKWTKELMTYVNSGNKIPDTVKNRYNQTEVKETLKRETHCKCMYCESYISFFVPTHIGNLYFLYIFQQFFQFLIKFFFSEI